MARFSAIAAAAAPMAASRRPLRAHSSQPFQVLMTKATREPMSASKWDWCADGLAVDEVSEGVFGRRRWGDRGVRVEHHEQDGALRDDVRRVSRSVAVAHALEVDRMAEDEEVRRRAHECAGRRV